MVAGVTGVALVFVAFGSEFLCAVSNKVPVVIVLVENVEVLVLGIYARCFGIMCRNGGYVMRTAFRRVYHAYCLGCA